MKVLIFGGTGAIGSYLVDVLAKKNRKIFVTSRSSQPSKQNVTYIIGDASSDLFLKEVLNQHWDVIVDFMVYSSIIFRKRVDSLLKATDQYIFISSSRVYANSTKPITEDMPRLLDVSEDSDYLSTDEYALSKARQEDMLFRHAKKNWTIIRPYITYDKYRIQLGVLEKECWLYRALNNRPILFSEEINNNFTTMTHGSNVAEGIESIIGEYTAKGEAFHITSTKKVLWSEVLNLYADVLSKYLANKPEVHLQCLADFYKCHPGKYQIKYDRLYDREFDNSKINKYIDTLSFIDPLPSLKTCLEKFLEDQRFLGINWVSEAIKDRKSSTHTSLNEICGIKQKIKYLVIRHTNFIYK